MSSAILAGDSVLRRGREASTWMNAGIVDYRRSSWSGGLTECPAGLSVTPGQLIALDP